MANPRRASARRDRQIVVTGDVRKDLDLDQLARVIVSIARNWEARSREGESSTTCIETAEPRPTPPLDLCVAAQELGERLLAPLGRRWLHVQSVAARAALLVDAVPKTRADSLVAGAWLHDIGYADEVAVTGFHALDGARFLQRQGWPDLVVRLVAHHTGALVEAEERGALDDLLTFEKPPPKLLDALTTADLVTGPGGDWVRAEDRVTEILDRYGPEHPVHRAVRRSAPQLMKAVHRVEVRTRGPVQPDSTGS